MLLDSVDKRLLRILQSQGDISNLELAERVGLSATPCARRVKALRDAGIIEQTVVQLNADKLGLALQAIVFVTLKNHAGQVLEAFESTMKSIDSVVECLLLTGHQADYMVKVVVRDMREFQSFILNDLTAIDHVRDVQSSFVMRESLKARGLPIL